MGQRSRSSPSRSIKPNMTMAEDRANETAALREFRQRYRKSEVIFEEGSSGSEMYLIHSGFGYWTEPRDEEK